MQGLTSISGVASGLDTDTLIQKILEVGRRPITQYQTQQTTLQNRLKAYQDTNTRLAALRDAASALSSPSLFQSRTATSSSTSVATVVAETGATQGEYAITVESVARAHQTISQTFTDLDTTRVGTGDFTLTSGGKSTTITVDSSNNTLAGLRDAINRSGSNVRASIVQDGDSSYRLMLASKETGTANAITVTNGLSGGSSPAFSDLQAAQDARVTLGSGANAITAVRSNNTIRDLIPGATLTVGAESATPITVTVGQDTAAIETAVQKLVDQYNAAADFMNQQSKFDPEKKTGGTLLGDFTLRNVQGDLSNVFANVVPGLNSAALSEAGITLNGENRLSLDTSLLREKLLDDPDAVSRVFALTTESTNAAVNFVAAGDKTKLEGTAFAVEITQAARQARVTGGVEIPGVLTADETVTVNGVTVELTAGMTSTQVLSALNAVSTETGAKASLTGADGTGVGNFLTLKSNGYGSATSLSVVSTASNAGGTSSGLGDVAMTHDNPGGEGGLGTGEDGLDVQGTINGEAATGKGQILTGDEENENTDGLRLRITATETGSLGTISLYNGIANAAAGVVGKMTDGDTGAISMETDSLDQRIADLQKVIDEKEAALTRQEEALRLKFNALESTMSQMQSQSSYLTSQLAALAK
jgi:flagellar hook-associated protein 2